MNKYFKRVLSIFLIVCLLVSPILTVQADKKTQNKQIHISTAKEFVDFSKLCKMDSYSKNLTVHIDNDIDLSKSEFESIPIFYGTLLGHGHVIKGIKLSSEGANQGLFRFLTTSSSVKNLLLEGKIAPVGRSEIVGALAGFNAGTIENCNFNGEIGGGNFVGGLVGINTVTGLISNSSAEGTVYGKHFVGGIAGANKGVIRNCQNFAAVNTTEQQNIVEISDITVGSMTGTEAANTVTDIGGIAGTSSGVVKTCKNYAFVGYNHMGYNVGGIVGSQLGYLTACENYAKINGRKEVGGIVGQMEPSAQIEFTTDSLQLLQKQLKSIYYRSHHISNTVDGSNGYVKDQFITLGGKAKDAIEALEKLTPEDEEGLKDPDRQQAALNVLSSSANSMMQTMGDIHSSSKNTTLATTNDFTTIINQIDNMAATLCDPTKKLGGIFSDVSDKDTKKDYTGKVENSFNYGLVCGDLNAGGIVGSIAWENDFDPEDDWNINGEISMNFESEVRAVILNCENYAEVSAKKRNAGGVVGRLDFGLVKNCVNTGKINAPTAEYVGGIAGDSKGYLRNNNAKCELFGKSYVGGIAGSAVTVTDCTSMIFIEKAKDKYGAVLGLKGKTLSGRDYEIKRNYYLIAKKDFGAIDGISYAGVAQPLGPKSFFKLPKLNNIFKKSKITFVGEYGIIDILYVDTGKALNLTDIPPVPEEHGKTGEWENLKDTDLKQIYFDLTFHTAYTPFKTTVQSKALRLNGKPILMAQSYFSNLENFELKELKALPKVDEKLKVVECWEIPKFADVKTQLRYAVPKGYSAEDSKIMVRNAKGDWKEVEFTVNNSYLVFSVDETENAICFVTQRENSRDIILIISAIGVLVIGEALLVTFILKKKQSKKAKKAAYTEPK